MSSNERAHNPALRHIPECQPKLIHPTAPRCCAQACGRPAGCPYFPAQPLLVAHNKLAHPALFSRRASTLQPTLLRLQLTHAALVDHPRSPPHLMASASHSNALDSAEPKHVVVIGAGVAGLVAAREAVREGLRVTVLEKSNTVGGVWVYTDETESDPTGVNSKHRLHGSMYRDLRTNLPRQVMGYTDFPFAPEAMNGRSKDSRTYPSHFEVLAYLEAFADTFQLRQLIQFRSKVTHVAPLSPSDAGASSGRPDPWPRWRVTVQHSSQGGTQSDHNSLANGHTPALDDELHENTHIDADAVMVCNGHYSEPNLPSIPGMHDFPGRQMHTHNYRHAGPFKGHRVCIIGAQASGVDIALEIAAVAEQAWVCSRYWPEESPVGMEHPILGTTNLFAVPPPVSIHADSSMRFEGGLTAESVDFVVYATGYRYSYPFLDASCGVSIKDNRVGPAFKHTLIPSHGPTLSFLGLPFKVVPAMLFEAQARWVCRALSGRIQLPSEAAMLADVHAWYEEVEQRGWPSRCLGPGAGYGK